MRTETTPATTDLLAADGSGANSGQTIGDDKNANSTRFDEAKVAAIRLAILNEEFRINAAAIADQMILRGHMPS